MRQVFCVFLLFTGAITASARSILPDVRHFREINRSGSIGVIYDVAIRPDNTQVAIGTSTGLYLYDLATLKQLSNFGFYSTPVGSVAWSPDGRYLAYVGVAGDDGQYLLDESRGGRGYIWDAVENRQVSLPNKSVARLAWSPDGHAIAGVVYDDRVSGLDVDQWSFNAGRVAFKHSYTVPQQNTNIGEFDWVGGYLAALVYSGNVAGVAVWQQDAPHVVDLGTPNDFTALAPAPDGKSILLQKYGGGVSLLDLGTLQVRTVLNNDYDADQILWSPERRDVFLISSGQIKVVNRLTWQTEENVLLPNATQGPYIERITPDGKYALGSYRAGQIAQHLILYRLPGWQIQQTTTFPPVAETGALLPSPSHEFRAAYDDDTGQLSIYRSADMTLVFETALSKASGSGTIPSEDLQTLGWSPDSHHLALENANSDAQQLIIVAISAGPPVQVSINRFTPPMKVFEAQWLPDSRHLLIYDVSTDDGIAFLDVNDLSAGAAIQKAPLQGRAQVLAAMSDYAVATDGEGLKLIRFDPTNYQLTSAPALFYATAPAGSKAATISATPDLFGHFLLLHLGLPGSPNETLAAWNTDSIAQHGFSLDHPLWKFTYQPDPENGAKFTTILSGTHLLVVRVIFTYKIFDLDTGTHVGDLRAPEDDALAYLPEAGLLAMGQDNDDIAIFQVTRQGLFPKPLVRLHGHTTTWLPDGGEYWRLADLYWQNSQLISEGGDGTLRTWGIPAGSSVSNAAR